MSESEKVPDSISFSVLRKLHAEKGQRLDFSNPQLSADIGDLAFLFSVFCAQKFKGETFTHHHIFLMDVVVTNLRREYENHLDSLIREGASTERIKMQAKFMCNLSLIEAMLDGMVAVLMKQGSFKSTLPSYRLVKSLDPSVRPHEIEEWVRDLGVTGE